jgi:catechol-2,3-dioxygenase
MAHVVFRTNKLEEMKDWYCTVLEAKPVFENGKLAFLSYDDEHHRVALVSTQQFVDKPAEPSVGFHHSAFTYDSLDDLFATFERLRKAGISPVRSIRHGPTLSFYYRDPDRNEVELQVDRFENSEDATRWMQGEAYARNPIGIEFDPDEVIGLFRSGVPLEDLMRRPDE